MLDIWRRINANAEEFFLPHVRMTLSVHWIHQIHLLIAFLFSQDFEVSADELQDAIQKARSWRGPPG